MSAELKLRNALEEYKKDRKLVGKVLPEVIDEVEAIFRDKVEEWCDEFNS